MATTIDLQRLTNGGDREVPGAALHGLEIDPGHAATARRNVPPPRIASWFASSPQATGVIELSKECA